MKWNDQFVVGNKISSSEIILIRNSMKTIKIKYGASMINKKNDLNKRYCNYLKVIYKKMSWSFLNEINVHLCVI